MKDVFVYGTLLAGQPQGGLLKRFERTPGAVSGRLYRMPAGYPALRLDEPGEVLGELVRGVDVRMLSLLDQYEGVDEGLYQRVTVDVTSGLRTFAASAWVMTDPASRGGIWVPEGRWRGVIRR